MKARFPRIYAFTVTTTPQLLLRRNAKRKAVLIYNNGTVTVELVSAGGTYGSGIPVDPDVTYRNGLFNPQGEYWIVAASDTCDVRIEEDIQEE